MFPAELDTCQARAKEITDSTLNSFLTQSYQSGIGSSRPYTREHPGFMQILNTTRVSLGDKPKGN